MIEIDYAKLQKEGDIYPWTLMVLHTEEDKNKLQKILNTLSACRIEKVYIDMAPFFEGSWAVSFPHHEPETIDPIEEIRKEVGPLRE